MMISFVDGAEGDDIFPINRHKFGVNRFRSEVSESAKANDRASLHDNSGPKWTFAIFSKSKTCYNGMDLNNLKTTPDMSSDFASDQGIGRRRDILGDF
jgi:hypothetical protein